MHVISDQPSNSSDILEDNLEERDLPDHQFHISEKVYKTGKKRGQSHVTLSLTIQSDSLRPYVFMKRMEKRTPRGQCIWFFCTGCHKLGSSIMAKAKRLSTEEFQLLEWPTHTDHKCSPVFHPNISLVLQN